MKPYILAAGAAVTVLLASCGSSDTKTNEPASAPAAPSSAAAPTTAAGGSDAAGGIEIKDFKFGGTLTVKPGAEVTVTNKDTAAHTATGKAKEFDSGNIDAGASGKFTAPAKAGSFKIICKYHPRMAGTLIVK